MKNQVFEKMSFINFCNNVLQLVEKTEKLTLKNFFFQTRKVIEFGSWLINVWDLNLV